MNPSEKAEVVIIGGSCAGLSAALTLGRARRQVVIVDDGHPRNGHASFSYGFYTRDKTPPAELNHLAREQLAPYDVRFLQNKAIGIEQRQAEFLLTLQDGTTLLTGKLLLATGVADELSDLPGLKDCWGKTVFSCPYCDGWEMRDKKLAVISNDHTGYGFSLLMQQWSKDILLCTDGAKPHHAEQVAYLASCGITVIDTPISQLTHHEGCLKDVIFADGRTIAREGIFTHPGCHLRNGISAQLGCELMENNHHLVVDDEGRTTIPGVYAAGDIAEKHSQIAFATASGVRAAFTINDDLIRDLHG